jgi:hypothetical protein
LLQFSKIAAACGTDASAGADSVRRMQELADSGQGLNEFINRVVKKNYAEKW